MDLKSMVILPIVIGVAVFALLGLMSDFNTFYDVIPDGNYSNVYNQINTSFESSINLSESLQNTVEGSERSGVVGDIVLVSGGIWKALKMPFQTLNAIKNMFGQIFNVLPFPSWVMGVLVTVFVVMITFLILGAIMRHRL